jgi:uncharacterized protein (UPF0261 family)
MIERLNRALGPTIVVLPAKGFARPNQEGGGLYVPEGNQAVIREFQSSLRPEIPVILADLHINDPEFADIVADCAVRLILGEVPHDVVAQWIGNGPSE